MVLNWSKVMLNDGSFRRRSAEIVSVPAIDLSISLCAFSVYCWPQLSSMNNF